MTVPETRRAARPPSGPAPLDVGRLRREFPVLRTPVQGKPLVYLDNAATSQKPRVVVEAEADFTLLENANVHRGVHTLSQRATTAYDRAREEVRGFLHAAEAAEIIFTAGTTAGLNLVAQSYARPLLRAGDEILLTEMEHHSNIVPWQLVAQATGARIRAIPVTESGELALGDLDQLINQRTRVVALAHVSNVLGTVNPVRRVADRAHAVGAVVVVDGAQAVAHMRVDVQALDADFYAAGAHKMFGPTGVGFLYGRRELLDRMPPWQGGGGMIQSVTLEETTFAPIPARFEAGTPPIAQAIGLGAAIRWLRSLNWPAVQLHETDLLGYATTRVSEVPGLRLIGTAAEKVGVLSFTMTGIHPHDVGTVLDLHGVAVRASHHCAQPLMRRFGIPGTVRASFAMYNTTDEVDTLVAGLREARKVFG
jgi:cysteine desulfurase/selenocysteine lyase